MRRKLHPSEHAIQCAVIAACRKLELKYPELRGLIAIPNGGARHPAVAKKLKAEGVRAGVPDLFLPLPMPGGPAGLWIEMKAPGGRVSPAQRDFMGFLVWAGYDAVVCYSAGEALDVLTNYLMLRRRIGNSR